MLVGGVVLTAVCGQLLQRMGVVPASVGHGGRSKLHPLVASELIARVGLLVQVCDSCS